MNWRTKTAIAHPRKAKYLHSRYLQLHSIMKGEKRTLSVICIIVIKTIITITTIIYISQKLCTKNLISEKPIYLSTYFKSKLSWVSIHVADPKKLTIIIHVPRNLLIGFTMHCETKRPELKNNQSHHLLGFFVVVFDILVFLTSVCSSLLLFSHDCYNWDKNLLANFSYSF